MKSISRKDFTAVGKIEKTHGTKGELRVSLFSNRKFKEWAFIEIHGKPVPFYIQSLQATFDDEAILKLKDVQTVEQAALLVGYALLLPVGKRKKNELLDEDDVTGFQLVDVELGVIGVVEKLEEYPNQLLFRTQYNGAEVLIPAVDAFIVEINEQNQTIYLSLPEGLLDV